MVSIYFTFYIPSQVIYVMRKGIKMNCLVHFIRTGAEVIGYFVISVIILGLLSQLLYGRTDYDKKSY
jgi:hypothetical protein